MNNRTKKKTLRKLFFSSIIMIVSLQVVLFIGIIILSGTPDRLDNSMIQTYKNTVDYRGKQIEQQLNTWADISDYYKSISSIAETLAFMQETKVSQVVQFESNRERILNSAVDYVLECLREQEVTGCFIILENGSEKKDSIYLRDLDPKNGSESNEDVLVEAGPGKYLLEKGFTLDSKWSTKLPIDAEAAYYWEPFNAGNEHPEMTAKDLGYFSTPFRLRDGDVEIISFSMPLLDENHKSYGVVGICITLDYLKKFIPYTELTFDSNASFYLAVTEDEARFKTVVAHGGYFAAQAKSSEEYETVPAPNGEKNFREVTIHDVKYDLFYYPCSIYNSNTPFSESKWVLGSVVSHANLHQSSRNLILSLVLTAVLAFGICIISGNILSRSMVKPLGVLVQGMKKQDASYMKLPRTNIVEIDTLAEEVERQSHQAYKAGAKMADILSLSNVGIGVVEYEKDKETIFCTEKVLDIFQFPKDGWSDNRMLKSQFFSLLKGITLKTRPLEDENGVYSFIGKGSEETRYVSIKTSKEDDKTLCVYMDVTKEILEKQKIKRERDYDILTNLYNRSAFTRNVQRIMESKELQSALVSMWDLDNLKFVNDNYGHEVGDKYLCKLSEAFHKNQCDNMIVGRMSGDEFMVFIYNEDVSVMYEKLKKVHSDFQSEKFVLSEDIILDLSVSAGTAVYGIHGTTLGELLRHADFAMYEVKNGFKGDIHTFDKEHYIRDYILVNGVGELNRVLKEESVRYRFQPIISVKDRNIFAYEVLLTPVSDMLRNPQEFLQIAESQSKMKQVERITWFHSTAGFFAQNGDKTGARLFINSIPNQCLSEDEFEQLENLYGDRLRCLVMEVTENSRIDTGKEAIKAKWCAKWGIEMALDDYGAGYSNNDVLLSREFEFIKLDMGIVRDIHIHPNTRKLVESIIEYCHQKNRKVIAEGIEKKEELKVVVDLGADYVQGFLLAKPAYELQVVDLSVFDEI